MQVIHGLAAVAVGVDDGPIARRREPLVRRDLGRESGHPADREVVHNVIGRREVRFRDDDNVLRRLRMDVAESETVFRLGHLVHGNLASHHPAEEALFRHRLLEGVRT